MRTNFKSAIAGGKDQPDAVADAEVPEILATFPIKHYWFATRPTPYVPHVWQYLFHGAHHEGHLRRYRHVA